MLDAYANAQQVEGAIGVFRRIKENGLEPDMYSYSTLIKAFVQDARVDDAFIVFENMKKLGLYSSQVSVLVVIRYIVWAVSLTSMDLDTAYLYNIDQRLHKNGTAGTRMEPFWLYAFVVSSAGRG